jgi:hypothetical protein
MEMHFIGTVGRRDVYHRVRIVGDGEVDRSVDQAGEVLLEMGDILPVELFHAVTQVDSSPDDS